jgi:hypothetical protein
LFLPFTPLWRLLDSSSPGSPFSKLNAFQMVGLGTRSEVLQIIICTMGNWLSLQQDLEMKCTLLSSHWWGEGSGQWSKLRTGWQETKDWTHKKLTEA